MRDFKDKEKAGRYSAIKTRLFFADIAVSAFGLIVFQLFFSRGMAEASWGVSGGFYLACFIYATVFTAFMYMISFPLHYYASYTVEHDFDLSNQSVGDWLKDEAKSIVLSFLLSVGCIIVFYSTLRFFGDMWWVVAATAWVFFTVILARIFPVLIIPLFYNYQPLNDEELKKRILALSENSGIGVLDVCRIDLSKKTKKANAALVGFGSTRKVVVSDTLQDAFDLDEIEAVIAHEFGHHAGNHIWKLLAFSGVVTYCGFYALFLLSEKLVVLTKADGIGDLYLLPSLIFLMSVFGMAVLPLQNLFSRVLEREADAFALEKAGKADKFITMMEKLADINLSERNPAFWKKVFFYDHPPAGERVAFAEKKSKQGVHRNVV